MELDNEESRLSPRERLGRRLRRLREGKGLSLRKLSDLVGGYPHSYLGRVELGQQLPSEALITALEEFYGTDGMLMELLELAHDSTVADYSQEIIAKQREAARIQVFTSSLIPGLLQTEEYARALFRRSLPNATEDRLSELVTTRIRRQRILDGPEAPLYWAIIDETALRRTVGGPKRMVTQIHHLLRAVKRPNVTAQVLPFSEGAHPMMGGGLTLLTLRNGGTMAFVESFKSGEKVTLPKRVVELTQLFDVARSLALPEEKSLDLIRAYLREYEHEDDEDDS
jgi:transcriptional regulator with XRE-family HTH domain